jgi:predicted MFS family arabinose efflux permease
MLLLLALCGLAVNFASRFFDPLVTEIAREFTVPIATAALLSSAFALPFSFGQPIIGPLGDALGKPRIFKICIWIVALSAVGSALSTTLGQLFASRILTGIAAGGTIPLALAMLGDAVPPERRQVALAQVSAGTVIGQLVGLSSAGVLAETFGWRVAVWVPAVIALLGAIAATLWLRGPPPVRRRVRLRNTIVGYRRVFRNPAAVVCFVTVFIEGIAVYGQMPFIVAILEHRGVGGPREAGFVIAGFATGAILLTLVVGRMLRWIGAYNMMRVGGVLAGIGIGLLAVPAAWPVDALLFVVIGFGFFMLHNSLQNRVTELAPRARGSAVALHYFCFFVGQAVGPVLFGLWRSTVGTEAGLGINALVMAVCGAVCAALLRRAAARA